MDNAMPTRSDHKSAATKGNSFPRCDTSELVQEHRNRRPTVFIEMNLSEGVDLSESLDDESDEGMTTNKEDRKSENSQRLRRNLTPAQDEQVSHDWSKPSVHTVDAGALKSLTPFHSNMQQRKKLLRSTSDSEKKGFKLLKYDKHRNHEFQLAHSLSVSNVFEKEPRLNMLCPSLCAAEKNSSMEGNNFETAYSTFEKLLSGPASMEGNNFETANSTFEKLLSVPAECNKRSTLFLTEKEALPENQR
jgi:hypothetical protein